MAEREQLPVPQARAGDAKAWDALFKRYQLPLYAYVFELVHNEQVSLDIVQETFINAVRHIGTLRDADRFGSWLFGITGRREPRSVAGRNKQAELIKGCGAP